MLPLYYSRQWESEGVVDSVFWASAWWTRRRVCVGVEDTHARARERCFGLAVSLPLYLSLSLSLSARACVSQVV